jgi:hypothetical protein
MTKARDLADLGNKTSLDEINDAYDAGALSNRNLIINGAMQVAQRGTSATTDGYNTVDRFKMSNAGNDEAPTASQQVLTSSDTGVWEKGFRHSYRLTNGNQTSGAQANDRIAIQHIIEAQHIASSGWNYTSSSSYITLSFWCKSSVAQNFYARLQTSDGTSQGFAFETGALSANTWTKVTQIISGNSNLQFDNDNGTGLVIEWPMYRGTDKTGSMTLNSWAAFNSAVRVPDMTSTWYTTDNATFEITGVQLEVGDTATPFEHRSYGDELVKCKRYFEKQTFSGGYQFVCNSINTTTTQVEGFIPFEVEKRASPTVTSSAATTWRVNGIGNDANASGLNWFTGTPYGVRGQWTRGSGTHTTRDASYVNVENASPHEAYVNIDAEL